MLRGISRLLLRMMGWKVRVDVPDYPKSVICVAPHTSNVDFFLCELAITSVGRHAGFLMKKAWFFWPLGVLLRAIGGVAVDRGRSRSLTSQLIEKFKKSERLTIAITPEGTRSRTARWHTGFLRVALEADVPLCLAALDFKTRTISMTQTFRPSGNPEADMLKIKEFYRPFTAKYPHKFTTDPE